MTLLLYACRTGTYSSRRMAALQRQAAELLMRADAVAEAEYAEYGRERRREELPERLQRVEEAHRWPCGA